MKNVLRHLTQPIILALLNHAAYRNTIYTRQFPIGSWNEVKGLALPGFMIEIGMEVHKAR